MDKRNNTDHLPALEWFARAAENHTRMENDKEFCEKVKKFTFGDVIPITKVQISDNTNSILEK